MSERDTLQQLQDALIAADSELCNWRVYRAEDCPYENYAQPGDVVVYCETKERYARGRVYVSQLLITEIMEDQDFAIAYAISTATKEALAYMEVV